MLEEVLRRAGPAYKKHFLEKDASIQAAAALPTKRVSAITTRGMWQNHLKYFRIALAICTSVACLNQAKHFMDATNKEGKSGKFSDWS